MTASTICLPYHLLAIGLGLQQSLVSEGPLQRRLHLHGAKLFDGEVQMFGCLSSVLRVAVQEQLSQCKVTEGDLRAEAQLGRVRDRLVVIGASGLSIAPQQRGATEVPSHTGRGTL